MNIWRSLGGSVSGRLICPQPENTLQQMAQAGAVLWDIVTVDPITADFRFTGKDMDLIQSYAKAGGGRIRILSKHGIYWTVKEMLKRPVFILGLLLLIAAALYLPTRILFVQVEGNSCVPTRQILYAAEAAGVRFGASRSGIRSEQIKNRLMEDIPQLQWAGINTYGCRAVISVRERSAQIAVSDKTGISSLVADRDGYILSANATRGDLLVKPGDTVTEGQVLISGYTDCGILIRAERAEGEVMAVTNRKICAIGPSTACSNVKTGKVLRKISILLGKKRIFLWKDSGISLDSCGRMYKEYYMTLPGGFRLPLALCVESFFQYESKAIRIPESDLAYRLEQFSLERLEAAMTAGSVLSQDIRLVSADEAVLLQGSYVCQEMIGRVCQEQIGE